MIKKATLINENEKLKREIYIWRNIGIGINASVKEKEEATKTFLEQYSGYNYCEVCRVIHLSKGTYFNFINNKVEKTTYEIKDESLLKEIKIVFEESNRIYGVDKINAVLRKKGIITSARKISQLMKSNNLIKQNVMKRPKPQVIRERCNYFRNLLNRQFDQQEPNKVWVSDLLEINLSGVKYYLCAILDLFARKVLSWRVSHRKSDNLTINAIKEAFEIRNEPVGLIFHSDQGLEFTTHNFMNTLKVLGIKQSFSYPGSPNDNAAMEGFYSILRREEVNIHINKYVNSRGIRDYLTKYFYFYNNKRIHRSLDDRTPQEVEDEWFKKHSN